MANKDTVMIRQYEKGDVPAVAVAYLRGVILQDGTFNCNGHCVWITDHDHIDADHCVPEDLFIEV